MKASMPPAGGLQSTNNQAKQPTTIQMTADVLHRGKASTTAQRQGIYYGQSVLDDPAEATRLTESRYMYMSNSRRET
jgi:hypothetical protein